MRELLFDLIRVSIGTNYALKRNPSDEEWRTLSEMVQGQAILGITFLALDKLSQLGQKPPMDVLYEWIGSSEQIKAQNRLASKRCIEVSSFFEKAGFKTCILKGLGNALLYSEPMLRDSGDIDLWVGGEKNDIISFVKERFPGIDTQMSSHHVGFPIFHDIVVEVHYAPTYSLLRRYQSKLNLFIEECKPRQFDNPVRLTETEDTINVPTDDFNMVFQLSHMQRHFFGTGIGFRHIIDYYYLLKKVNICNSECQKREVKEMLASLGLLKFGGAVMWVLQKVLLMEKDWLICEPDEKRGKLLLNEIMQTGNFGYSDRRESRKLSEYSATLGIIARNMRLIRLFPEEALYAPITGVSRRFSH